jgi:hypothetical protein
MRIPVSKVYRAFPELDRFDDESCERYVRQAMQVALKRRVHRHLLEVGIGALVFLGLLTLGLLMFRAVGAPLMTPGIGSIILLVYYSVLVAVPIVASLMARDWWLRRAVALRLRSARCPKCEYSLLGLPVQRDAVLCPECGERVDLESHGLTIDDVLGHAEPAVTSF